MWARGHSYREISDLHRRAAIALGVEREWAYVPMKLSECPACGEKVKAGVAVCKHCHAILDAEKAAKHGLGPAARERRRESAADSALPLGGEAVRAQEVTVLGGLPIAGVVSGTGLDTIANIRQAAGRSGGDA